MKESLAILFRDELQLDVPSLDTDLFDSGILDSLKLAELLVCIESHFGTQINLDDLEFENFRSISRIAHFLQARASQISA